MKYIQFLENVYTQINSVKVFLWLVGKRHSRRLQAKKDLEGLHGLLCKYLHATGVGHVLIIVMVHTWHTTAKVSGTLWWDKLQL